MNILIKDSIQNNEQYNRSFYHTLIQQEKQENINMKEEEKLNSETCNMRKTKVNYYIGEKTYSQAIKKQTSQVIHAQNERKEEILNGCCRNNQVLDPMVKESLHRLKKGLLIRTNNGIIKQKTIDQKEKIFQHIMHEHKKKYGNQTGIEQSRRQLKNNTYQNFTMRLLQKVKRLITYSMNNDQICDQNGKWI
ncbi:hypothetical protein pb186bvf_020083 [Paramecium bursaria]